MLKSNRAVALVLAVSLIGLVAGTLQLLELRFSAGDIYPPYSSLRSDPLGSKALWESLQHLPGLTVSRNFDALGKIESGRGTTLVLAGIQPDEMRSGFASEFRELEHFAITGGRIVITLRPEAGRTWQSEEREKFEKEHPDKSKEPPAKPKKETPVRQPVKPKDEPDKDEPASMKRISLKEAWALDLNYTPLERDDDGTVIPADIKLRGMHELLPAELEWRSAVYFKNPDERWSVIYERDGKPVVVERAMGEGSIVVMTDSWHLSNEALRADRQPELLTWLVGTKPVVLFDETHLGVQVDPGVASLARKYHLHGLFIGLLLLATLYVWQQAATFVPAPDEITRPQGGDLVVGRDSASGFVNLLRRCIGARDLLKVCYDEWFKTHGRGRSDLDKHISAMRQALEADQRLEPRERRPVETYRQMCHSLRTHKPADRPATHSQTPS